MDTEINKKGAKIWSRPLKKKIKFGLFKRKTLHGIFSSHIKNMKKKSLKVLLLFYFFQKYIVLCKRSVASIFHMAHVLLDL